MNTLKKSFLALLSCCTVALSLYSQSSSSSIFLSAQPVPDRTVSFNVLDSGVYKPIIWGLDLAWLSETNIRRGIAFMGADRVDIVRSSFRPTNPLLNDSVLQGDALTGTNDRLNIIKTYLGANTKVVLNSDHPSVDSYFSGNAARWAKLIEVTAKMHQNIGRKVITVSPFNEPDYSATGQGTINDFYNICTTLKTKPFFDSIRISGGNTLNCDQALTWYNYLKTKLDEGNTHQLAGSFDNYANFYSTVKANGDHGTNDELHNVMEAMVGVQYGMQTGIWWGTAELARGEFVKASDGRRLGYAEHRPNWTAASVYRNTEGKIQAFGGTSERQAVTTTYRFVSKNKDVFFDGYGPQREYTMVLPGGTGYQNGQTNAERVVNITWGEDIQPVINGKYILVNRLSSKVMEVLASSTTSGANICQRTYKSGTNQQWNVTPVDSRVGGDFSYFTLTAVHSGKAPDVLNFSLDNGARVIQWDDTKGVNQQWYLEYAGDGWFYIRNRHSAKCMEVAAPYVSDGAVIQQSAKNPTSATANGQLWRFLPIDATVEFKAPAAPTNLTATANAESVKLEWTANAETDLAGYTIFRSEAAGGPYNTIARNIKTNSYVDNTTTSGGQFFYVIKAVDYSLNQSVYSGEVSASPTQNNDLVAHLPFNGNLNDTTINLNHAATYGTISYADGKFSKAISLNGTNAFIQLPSNLLNQSEITIATWVYWNGSTFWQRIFDFGNDQNQYMFLTPCNNLGQLTFGIKNGGSEQLLKTSVLPSGKWVHVAVTLSATGGRMYVDGKLAVESSAITIKPTDFKPALNYIGRSQFSDPLFNGRIDDFKIYNYALNADEIAQISIYSGIPDLKYNDQSLSVWPMPAKDKLLITYTQNASYPKSNISLLDLNGKQIMTQTIEPVNETELNISGVSSGIYMLRLTNSKETVIRKVIISH